MNVAGESPLDCTTNHLAEVGMEPEGDEQKLINMDVDNAIQGEHSCLQGELFPHYRSSRWAEVRIDKDTQVNKTRTISNYVVKVQSWSGNHLLTLFVFSFLFCYPEERTCTSLVEAPVHDMVLSKFRSTDKGSVYPDEGLSHVASLYKVILSLVQL